MWWAGEKNFSKIFHKVKGLIEWLKKQRTEKVSGIVSHVYFRDIYSPAHFLMFSAAVKFHDLPGFKGVPHPVCEEPMRWMETQLVKN